MKDFARAMWTATNISDNLKYLAMQVCDGKVIAPSHIEQVRYNVSRFIVDTENYNLSILSVLKSIEDATPNIPDKPELIIEMYQEISQFNFEMLDTLRAMVKRPEE